MLKITNIVTISLRLIYKPQTYINYTIKAVITFEQVLS